MTRKSQRLTDARSGTDGSGGLSRREFLKSSALVGAAVGISAVGAGALTRPARAEAAARAAPYTQGLNQDEFLEKGAGKFAVDIPGCPSASANVESVKIEDLTVDVRERGGDPEWRIYAPGDAHYGKMTLKVRVGPQTGELRQWVLDATAGKNVRKSISIIIKERAGAEMRRYNLMDCFPITWDSGDYSPSGSVLLETLKVKVGYMSLPSSSYNG